MARPPKIPKLLASKIYKTGQTRGADDDVIFQNRVNRNNTVLIPLQNFEACKLAPTDEGKYDNGFIVLINPDEYFANDVVPKKMTELGLELGNNALLFYYSRTQWNAYNPVEKGLTIATSRSNPLGGQYVARVPSTTSKEDKKIMDGYSTTSMKGAGIRVYEFASSEIIKQCRVQLEYIYWSCHDATEVSEELGMSKEDIKKRVEHITDTANELGLSNLKQLQERRIINMDSKSICPLCLKEISAWGFYNKVQQAEGRAVSDLTVTQLNLFHIDELRIGQFNHKPYNLGWGHHHCNIVVKDAGIYETLKWMNEVVEINKKAGLFKP